MNNLRKDHISFVVAVCIGLISCPILFGVMFYLYINVLSCPLKGSDLQYPTKNICESPFFILMPFYVSPIIFLLVRRILPRK